MYICKNCGQSYTDYSPYCGRCGGEIVAAAPVEPANPGYAAPYGAAPAYHYEAAPVAPKATGGTIVMGIIGFILALESLFGIFISYVMAETSYYDYYSGYSYRFDEDVFAVAMFCQLIMSVLGLVFSSIARNKGFCGLAIAGKIIGIIGIVLNSIFFVLAIAGASIF